MESLNQIAILSVLWICWCILHSLLISRGVVSFFKTILREKFAYYRLCYNVFSFVTLLPILMYHFSLPEVVFWDWPGAWLLLKFVMYIAAFILFYSGYLAYDLQYVLGLKQIRELSAGRNGETMDFKTSGILEYVRHPWYSGGILLVWALGYISDVSLVIKVILTAYFIIGTKLEEKKLVAEIGEPYRQYCRRVPMLIPWKKPNN
jgi:protein-S-isoprenylcysteine O-methyltransferase Ste14